MSYNIKGKQTRNWSHNTQPESTRFLGKHNRTRTGKSPREKHKKENGGMIEQKAAGGGRKATIYGSGTCI